MKYKKGYTAVEVVVVIFIITLIIGISSALMQNMFKQYEEAREAADNPIRAMRIVDIVEEAVTGCIDVTVVPNEISIISSEGQLKIKATDFPNIEDLVFAKSGNSIVISMGGDLYWIPILSEG